MEIGGPTDGFVLAVAPSPPNPPLISDSIELSINRLQQLTSRDFQVMETSHLAQSPLDEDFVVGVNLCPQVRVSPGLDAAVAENRKDVTSTAAAMLDGVEIMSDEDDVVSDAAQRCGSPSLLDAVVAMESDDDEEPAVLFTPPASRINETDSDTDSEDLLDDYPFISRRRSRVVVSGAALDLCPTVDLSHLSSSSSSSDEDSEDEDSDNESSVACPRTWECDELSLDQIDRIIRSNMAEVEAKKPWRFVFRCLVMPFGFKHQEDPFDVFFLRWDEFWRLHGRAVWERAFWQPLLPHSTESYRRHGRQSRAQRDFRELATDLEERLGGHYRRFLSKALHEGWWYRIEPFPLRRLFLRDRGMYEQYLVERVKERFPRGRKFLLERGLKPMWWV